jgi:hypothetical protein
MLLLGICTLIAELVLTTPGNLAAGAVCKGWKKPVADLITLGLMDDVICRLNALAPSDRTVYVAGHSRGGALVGGVHVACVQLSKLY